MQVIEKRGYVLKDGKRFIPEHRGRIVSTFLENFFSRYVEYDFTAALESRLDEVSDGKLDWRSLLRQFWVDFAAAIDQAMELSVPDVMKTLDSELEKLFFTPDENGQIQRVCSKCGSGHLELKLGKFGPFTDTHTNNSDNGSFPTQNSSKLLNRKDDSNITKMSTFNSDRVACCFFQFKFAVNHEAKT